MSDLAELKRKLFVATRRLEQATDSEEKALLGADVRELEKRVETAKGPNADPPRYLRA